MPVTITALRPRSVIKATVEGLLDDEEMLRMVDALVQAVGSRQDHDIMLDTRRARSILSGADLERLSDDLGRHSAARHRKFAIVCARERLELVRTMENATRAEGPVVRVFTSMEDAWNWLGEASAVR